MPVVKRGGKTMHFPYTDKGKAAAAKARKRGGKKANPFAKKR